MLSAGSGVLRVRQRGAKGPRNILHITARKIKEIIKDSFLNA